jgi:hypothetical protein
MTDETRLKNAILAAREDLEFDDSNAAWERFADRIAAAMIIEIKAMKITYTSGLTAGTSPVAGTFNHTNS